MARKQREVAPDKSIASGGERSSTEGYKTSTDLPMKAAPEKPLVPHTPQRISPTGAVVTPPLAGFIDSSSSHTMLPPSVAPFVLPPIVTDNTGMTTFDTRLLLFQDQPFVLQRQAIMPSSFETITPKPHPCIPFSSSWDCLGVPGHDNTKSLRKESIISSHQRSMEDSSLDSLLQDFSLLQTAPVTPSQLSSSASAMAPPATRKGKNEPNREVKKPPPNDLSTCTSEDDIAAFLLKSLALVDRPVVTEEDEALERASLTTAERAAILSDALGIPPACNTHHLSNKKQKTDEDRKTTAFLVQLMKIEIEKIPLKKRHALVEAQMKCGVREFRDSRLEQFLRAEGMNAQVCSYRIHAGRLYLSYLLSLSAYAYCRWQHRGL